MPTTLFITWISDRRTCPKLRPANLFRELPFTENRFGLSRVPSS